MIHRMRGNFFTQTLNYNKQVYIFSYYPPGHGNVFESLNACGLLDKLIEEGRDVIFVSNVDNTAACVDVRIASVICRKEVDYVMEITEKTQQDIKVLHLFNKKSNTALIMKQFKGGTLVEYENCVKHLELPHVPLGRL